MSSVSISLKHGKNKVIFEDATPYVYQYRDIVGHQATHSDQTMGIISAEVGPAFPGRLNNLG